MAPRTRHFLAIVALVFLLPAPSLADEILDGFETQEVISDEWLEASLQGSVVGYMRQTILRGTYKGESAFAIRERGWIRLTRDGNAMNRTDDSVVITDDTLHPLRSRKQEDNAGFEELSERVYDEKRMTRTSRKGGVKTVDEHEVDRAHITVPELSLRLWYRHQANRESPAGTVLEGRTYDCGSRSTESYTYRFVEADTLPDGTPVHRWSRTDDDLPDVPSRLTVTPEGDTLIYEQGPMRGVRSSEAAFEAWRTETPAELRATLDTGLRVSTSLLDEIEWMRLRIRPKAGEAVDLELPPSSSQAFSREEDGWIVTLKRASVSPESCPGELDLDGTFERYLRATPSVQCEDDEIRAIAREAVGDAKTPFERVQRILAWLHANIEQTYEIVTQPSAKDVLRMRRGDCAELAVLFTALARSQGIPAREAEGFLFEGSGFTGHAWNEVYLGTWVQVDATRERLGVPGGYLLFGYDTDDNSRGTYGQMTLLLQCELDVEALEASGLLFDCREEAVYVQPEKGTSPIEVVRLSDGKEFIGRVEAADREALTLKSSMGTVTIPRKRLKTVEYRDSLSETRYTNEAAGLVLTIPSGWKRRLGQQPLLANALVEFEHESGQAIGVLLSESYAGDLESYAELLKSVQARQTPDLVDLGMTAQTLGGLECVRWVYQNAPSGPAYRFTLLMFRRGDDVFRLLAWVSVGQFGTYGPEIEKLLSGLKLLDTE